MIILPPEQQYHVSVRLLCGASEDTDWKGELAMFGAVFAFPYNPHHIT